MPWLQVSFPLKQAQVAAVESWLEDLGALAISLEDDADEPILELGPQEIRLWQEVRIQGLFDSGQDAEALRQSLVDQLGPESLAGLHLELIADQPWEQAWLKDFHPMRFGQRLWICPSGYRVDEPDALVIDLDPGLAFGSGTHPSTALCLSWLAEHPMDDKRIIDFGCGSGVLAIAALKLGAARAYGLDHDPQAILATRDNAERNGVLERLELFGPDDRLPDQIDPKGTDILLANILANTLMQLEPLFAQLLAADKRVLLAGILAEQADELMDVYSRHFAIKVVAEQEGWVLLQGLRLSC
jgi:ribosomal protein L11 methyltransferase